MPAQKATALTRRELLLAASAVSLVGCGRDAGSGAVQTVLVRGNGPDPDSLDPHKARSWEAMVVLRDLFECLTRLDANAATVPAAAERWTVSEDGLVYVFHLRANLKWSNGEPVVADDFAAGVEGFVAVEGHLGKRKLRRRREGCCFCSSSQRTLGPILILTSASTATAKWIPAFAGMTI